MSSPVGRRRRAFTVIELIAVIVILATISVMAAPAITNMQSTRARMAARLVLHDLSFARQYAMATGRTTWVVFDTSGAGTWSILVEDPSNPGRVNATALSDPATGVSHEQDLNNDAFQGVTITNVSFDSGDEIGFDWMGRPKNSAESDLAASGSVTFDTVETVSVSRVTGYVTY